MPWADGLQTVLPLRQPLSLGWGNLLHTGATNTCICCTCRHLDHSRARKSGAPSCFLFTFHFLHLNQCNYSSPSEQSICTHLQHPALLLFPGNAISACPCQLCLLWDTPSWSGFTFISAGGTFSCWERPSWGAEAVTSSARCEVGLPFDHSFGSDSMWALCTAGAPRHPVKPIPFSSLPSKAADKQ